MTRTKWFRPGGLSRVAREELGLERGEHVIASGSTRGGDRVVATDRALHLPGRTRVGWEEIEHATWRSGWLHVRETVVLGQEPREHHARLTEPDALPETVRERVTASIVLSRYVQLDHRRGVRIVARRRPGSTQLVWTLVFDAGLDPQDPDVRTWAEQMLDDVRRQTVS
ncbi:MAG: hypothetical protein ACRDQA_29410 [Nocardioidaceae bacterium]